MDKKIRMKTKTINPYIALVMFLYTSSLFSEDAINFNDNVVDNTPAAPIDSWIPFVLLITFLLIYRYFKKTILTK